MNARLSSLPTAEDGGWQASLFLGYVRRDATTLLANNVHSGPLRVQRPLYPEGEAVCHTYILHPPGGVVGGDRLHLEARVGSGAHALLTTPGATKFYRSNGKVAEQRVRLAAEDATLEWLPQETILYPRAVVKSDLHIELRGNARFLGWDIICLGLPARQETLATGSYHGCLRLSRDGRPLLLDRLVLSGEEDLSGPAGLRGQPVTGCMVATGVPPDLAKAAAECPSPEAGFGATTLAGDLLIARYLGPSASAARGYFTTLWTTLREALLARTPCPPRIWQT